jgi:hypothetical protein
MLRKALVSLLLFVFLGYPLAYAKAKKGFIDLNSTYTRYSGRLGGISVRPSRVNGKAFTGFFRPRDHLPGQQVVTIFVNFGITKRGIPLLRGMGIGYVDVLADLKADVHYSTVTKINENETVISAWIVETKTKKRVSTIGVTTVEDCQYGPYNSCGL